MPEQRVKCKVTMETAAWSYWVSIDDEDLDFNKKGEATIYLSVGPSHYMAWHVTGEHGTAYKITAEPPDGYKVTAFGKHPVERKIPAGFNDSADTLRIFIEEED